MDKEQIKSQVKQAYVRAKEYPDFMPRFKHEIQSVIDSWLPGSATQFWHVNADIDTLSQRSKKNGYKVKGFLNLVSEYIIMLVLAAEQKKKKPFDRAAQNDLFDSTPKE